MYKQLLYILLFVGFCGKDVLCKKHKLKRVVDRIVGGEDTTIQSYPYMAFLRLYDGDQYYRCGGAILCEDYIVTAAHCLSNIQSIQVRISSTYANSGGLLYEAISFHSHPFYNAGTGDYDVGLVQVDSMTLDGKNASAINLVESGSDVSDGEEAILIGWGTTGENETITNTLKKVSASVVGRDRCNELLGGGITARMFCVGESEGGRDTCRGDSGGPVVINNTLVGINSFRRAPCGRPDKPGVKALLGNEGIQAFIQKKAEL